MLEIFQFIFVIACGTVLLGCGGKSKRDAQEPSGMCPQQGWQAQMQRGQARGKRGSAGAVEPWRSQLWEWGAPSHSLFWAFLSAGPPGPWTARTRTPCHGGWMDASCSHHWGGLCNTPQLHLLNEDAHLLASFTQSYWLSHRLTAPDGEGQKFAKDAGCRINQLVTQPGPKASTCVIMLWSLLW